MKKSIKAIYMPQLEELELNEVANTMEGVAQRDYVSEINWNEFPYKPIVAFDVARSDNYLFISFFVRGSYIRAVNKEYNSHVYQDSCVEFFAKIPGDSEYYNFEFNCIGTALSSKRKSRTESNHYADDQMARIKTWSSLGNEPFEEREGIHSWQVVVAIPFDMMGIDNKNMPEMVNANFYKCGDKTSIPHYVSWNKIETENPDFHRPEFFGELYF